MLRIERQRLFVTRAAAMLGVLFLLSVAGLSVLDIIVREWTGRLIRGAGDLARLLTIIIIAACFPAGLLERRQIKVTLLGALLPVWANRVIEVLAALLTCLHRLLCHALRATGHRLGRIHHGPALADRALVVGGQRLLLGLHPRTAFRDRGRGPGPSRHLGRGLRPWSRISSA